jgi:thiol-disulfide isomerase/thioredoxin
MSRTDAVHMPSLDGATGWLNSEPVDLPDLRGHVVLVDFWTRTCINWLRTAPYVRAWADAYRDDGLIVIGVHTPEFVFERGLEGVRRATQARAIGYPVAVDDDYAIWNAFANHYWPALYFVDAAGIIRDEHFGEGRYEQSERTLQRLLGVRRDLVSVQSRGIEAQADWDHLWSPETYLGDERRQGLVSVTRALDERRRDSLPHRLRLNDWTLSGAWATEPESVLLCRPGGRISYRFHARDVHLVLSATAPQPVPFGVRLDGTAPGSSHGLDIDAAGHGVLDDGRMYQLVRQRDGVDERTLEITFHAAGARAFVFTFG